jgi:hypothetical protein
LPNLLRCCWLPAGKTDKAGNPVNVWTNFSDYGLQQPLGLLRTDLHRHPFRRGLEGVLDAIICDPPYGVRALFLAFPQIYNLDWKCRLGVAAGHARSRGCSAFPLELPFRGYVRPSKPESCEPCAI